MEQILLQASQQFLKLLVVLFFSTSVHAQIQTSYQIGSIGLTGSVNPIYSGPVLINGNDCFMLANGIQTFDLPQIGYFSTACRLLFLSEMGIRLVAFPNPVVNTVTVKSSEQMLPNSGTEIQLQLVDMNGKLMQTFHTDIKELNKGYQFPMQSIANGTYLVKVISGSIKYQVLSIIKSN